MKPFTVKGFSRLTRMYVPLGTEWYTLAHQPSQVFIF